MVVDGQWVTTQPETMRLRADALLELDQAQHELELLELHRDAMTKRASHIAALWRGITESDDYLRGPVVELLSLPEMEYGESQSLASMKSLANALIVARKNVTNARQKARKAGASV